MLKEFLSRLRPEETQTKLKLGLISVDVNTRNIDDILYLYPIRDTENNLRLAERNGVKPLSLKEIINQINPEKQSRIVLFDKPPVHGFRGNHWRILKINEELNSGELQFCGPFGNYDYSLIPSFNLSLDTPLFTGISLYEYELSGSPMSLGDVTAVIKEIRSTGQYLNTMKCVKNETLWSNNQGKLIRESKNNLQNTTLSSNE